MASHAGKYIYSREQNPYINDQSQIKIHLQLITKSAYHEKLLPEKQKGIQNLAFGGGFFDVA